MANGMLNKALDFILETQKDDDWICEYMLGIPDENRICAATCNNMNRICVKRFLKHFKSKRK